jgi:hypothetical protein
MRTAEILSAGQETYATHQQRSETCAHETRPTGRLTPSFASDQERSYHNVSWLAITLGHSTAFRALSPVTSRQSGQTVSRPPGTPPDYRKSDHFQHCRFPVYVPRGFHVLYRLESEPPDRPAQCQASGLFC